MSQVDLKLTSSLETIYRVGCARATMIPVHITRASGSRPRSDLRPLATALSNKWPPSSRLSETMDTGQATSHIDVNTSAWNSTPSSYNCRTYNQTTQCVVLIVFILIAVKELK